MDAMSLQAVPSLNTVYADRDGHVAYLYNARLPVRAEGFDWSQYLPSDTSRTLWTEYLPFASLPRVVDPPWREVNRLRRGAVDLGLRGAPDVLRAVYGAAVGDARSPHHADQAPLFAAGRLKPVWMDEAAVRAHLEREYTPD